MKDEYFLYIISSYAISRFLMLKINLANITNQFLYFSMLVFASFSYRFELLVRLSERNGDMGSGKLQIYKPDAQQWMPACITHWDDETPKLVCKMLGYG